MTLSTRFPRRFFVTGTDTDAGKTLVSAVLVAGLSAMYWKPVQTGYPEDRDTLTVMDLAGIPETDTFPETLTYTDPVSPHHGEEREGHGKRVADFILPDSGDHPLVVEGAGGVLVPLNRKETLRDLMGHLGLPVILVARTGLGTLNHTFLSIEALHAAELSVAGIIATGPDHPENIRDLARFSGVPVLGHIPTMPEKTPEILRRVFREVFGEVLLDDPAAPAKGDRP